MSNETRSPNFDRCCKLQSTTFQKVTLLFRRTNFLDIYVHKGRLCDACDQHEYKSMLISYLIWIHSMTTRTKLYT